MYRQALRTLRIPASELSGKRRDSTVETAKQLLMRNNFSSTQEDLGNGDAIFLRKELAALRTELRMAVDAHTAAMAKQAAAHAAEIVMLRQELRDARKSSIERVATARSSSAKLAVEPLSTTLAKLAALQQTAI